MEEFYVKLAEILEATEVRANDILADFPEWDSLTVLSVIAMLDAKYGVNLVAADLRALRTAEDLFQVVARRRKT